MYPVIYRYPGEARCRCFTGLSVLIICLEVDVAKLQPSLARGICARKLVNRIPARLCLQSCSCDNSDDDQTDRFISLLQCRSSQWYTSQTIGCEAKTTALLPTRRLRNPRELVTSEACKPATLSFEFNAASPPWIIWSMQEMKVEALLSQSDIGCRRARGACMNFVVYE